MLGLGNCLISVYVWSLIYVLYVFCLNTESVCPTRIPVASRDEKGFELLVGMKIHLKAKKIAGSLASEAAYHLENGVDITENTRWGCNRETTLVQQA